MIKNISVQAHSGKLFFYRNSFTGFQLQQIVEKILPGQDASVVTQGLVNENIIQHVYRVSQFRSTNTDYYQFFYPDKKPNEALRSVKSLADLLCIPSENLSKSNKSPGPASRPYAVEAFLDFCSEKQCLTHASLLFEIQCARSLASKAARKNQAKWISDAFLENEAPGQEHHLIGIDAEVISTALFDVFSNDPGVALFEDLYNALLAFVTERAWNEFIQTARWTSMLESTDIRLISLLGWSRVQPERLLIPRGGLSVLAWSLAISSCLEASAPKDPADPSETMKIIYSIMNSIPSDSIPSPRLSKSQLVAYIQFHANPKANEMDFLDTDDLEIARQLTLIDNYLYMRIERSELLNLAWSKPHLQSQATSLLTFITRFNTVSNWVATSILSSPLIRQRAKLMDKFIRLAWGCWELKNFSCATAIVAALNSAPLVRLKHTRSQVSRSVLSMLKDMEDGVSTAGNYKVLREMLQQCKTAGTPAVPYIGVFLSDLTFIEEGNARKVAGLIRFNQRQLVANVVELILSFQEHSYMLVPVDAMLRSLMKLPSMAEDKLYARSLVGLAFDR